MRSKSSSTVAASSAMTTSSVRSSTIVPCPLSSGAVSVGTGLHNRLMRTYVRGVSADHPPLESAGEL